MNENPMWIPLLFSVLALAGVIYLFLTKMDQKQAGPKSDFFKKDFKQGTQILQRTIDELKTRQTALEERIKILEEAKTQEDTEATEEVAPLIEATEEPSEQALSRTWYSVVPKNGIFFGRQLEETFKPREHIYRIEVLDEERAYYYLVDDSATRQHAFNIPDSYILPAMELEGTGRLAEAAQIDVQRGRLVKAGNNWQIEEKAVLNYSM